MVGVGSSPFSITPELGSTRRLFNPLNPICGIYCLIMMRIMEILIMIPSPHSVCVCVFVCVPFWIDQKRLATICPGLWVLVGGGFKRVESFSARVSWAGNSDNKLKQDWELRSTHMHETRGVACLGRDNSAARTPDEGFPPSVEWGWGNPARN